MTEEFIHDNTKKQQIDKIFHVIDKNKDNKEICKIAFETLNSKCLEDVEVGVIKREALEKELLQKPALVFEFMKWISEHLRRMQTKFRDLVLHGKKGALYSTLIRMTNSYGILKENGILIDLPLTNQELANFCATSRESVNRMLNELKKQSTISIHKGKITIHDLQFLKCEIACEDCSASVCSID